MHALAAVYQFDWPTKHKRLSQVVFFSHMNVHRIDTGGGGGGGNVYSGKEVSDMCVAIHSTLFH